jgi:hypothetical protein
MSLDVSLYIKSDVPVEREDKIFIREDGQNKEISREEWDKRFPGQKPITTFHETEDGEREVFSANITHNLNKMADEAGIYKALWRPEEIPAKFASEIITVLSEGLQRLKDAPEHFKKFNPANGWGTYEGLVSFVDRYLKACVEYPEAELWVSR